ncbi:hypothetical protein [Flavobacterium caseinilyticum]|uniref:hypothetical protein n=1 Tax=Flavobacterium caseinilyticum TaxID=2541732 RepID=UPI001404CAEE|nr:hypothetical protein [Flavobacterium caseinilyticum]
MTTSEIFNNYNLELTNKRIPIGTELIEAGSTTDPADVVFQTSFSELCKSSISKTFFLE